MTEPTSRPPMSLRAVWGLVLVCIALPLTFVPFVWAAMNDEAPSAYEATTLIAVPVGTIGLVLSLMGASDVANSEGRLRGGRIAVVAIVLGVLGAAMATPLIFAAIF